MQTNLHKGQTTMKNLQEMDPIFLNQEQQKEVRCEIQWWLKNNELMWRQMSRVMWLMKGDRNLKYFFLSKSIR